MPNQAGPNRYADYVDQVSNAQISQGERTRRPARTYDDWPLADGGSPARAPGTAPPGRCGPPAANSARADTLRAFTDAVLGLHRITEAVRDFIPMCSCGLPARCCDIIRVEHEVLGIPMPFTFGPLPRPPYHEA